MEPRSCCFIIAFLFVMMYTFAKIRQNLPLKYVNPPHAEMLLYKQQIADGFFLQRHVLGFQFFMGRLRAQKPTVPPEDTPPTHTHTHPTNPQSFRMTVQFGVCIYLLLVTGGNVQEVRSAKSNSRADPDGVACAHTHTHTHTHTLSLSLSTPPHSPSSV